MKRQFTQETTGADFRELSHAQMSGVNGGAIFVRPAALDKDDLELLLKRHAVQIRQGVDPSRLDDPAIID